jgi:uncharacterized protein YjbI with pentapeptide repeats
MLVAVDLHAQGRSFENEDISGRDMSGQTLDGTNFTGATLRNVNFRQASLRGAIFKDADLRNASFYKVDASGADFSGAEMGANGMDNANFSRANFEGVEFKNNPTAFRVDFRGANLKKTKGWFICSACDFRGADFRGANLLRLNPHPEIRFDGAVYDEATRFPGWLDPERLRFRRAG